jgi:hypothetical protein
LSATSASITNLALTSLTISSLSITNVSVASVTVSSVATFAAGSAAAPSITTTGDTNTGIFFPAADTIGFTEGGTESMRVDSSGRLLVGQTGALNNGTIDVLGTGRQAIVARVTDNVNSLFQGFNSSAVATFQVDGSGNGYFAGNLGIGTTSPLRRLAIAGDAQVYNTAADGASNTVIGRLTSQVRNYGTNIATASFASIEFATGTWPTGNIRFLTNGTDGTDGAGTERMRLDSSGNLGLGVTPSAWGSTWKALQISNWASLGAETSSTGECTLLQNAYASGASTFNYIGSFAATRYTLENSAHKWYTAPSGTAGNTISFTQAMTLDASGNLGIGTSSPGAKLEVYGGGTGTVTNAQIGNASTAFVLGVDSGNNCQVRTAQNVPIIFYTNNTERARITSGGELLVGTATSGGYLFRVNDGVSQFTQATSATDCADFWNRATSGDNKFVAFYTETSATSRGSITYNRAGGLVAYNVTSDYRAKDIIGPVQNSGAIIDALKVYEGQMKGATQSRPMLVAHEAQEHAPYAVTGEKDAVNEDGTPKYQQMDVSALVPLLLAEIQSLRARVAQLETK